MTYEDKAFPCPANDASHQGGMSLCDYFAGQALAAVGTWVPEPHTHLDEVGALEARAVWAYRQASEMLLERDNHE